MFERCYHFVPANRPDFLAKAGKLGADALVFDLEDSVAEADKQVALICLDKTLSENTFTIPLFLRVNGSNHPAASGEKDLFKKFTNLGLMIPKVENLVHFETELNYYGQNFEETIILIESFSGLSCLREVLGNYCVWAVGLGLEDMLSCFVHQAEELGILVGNIRSEIALLAAAAGVEAIDTISLDLSGGESLRKEALLARSAGMTAKFSIHPQQIASIKEVFSPRQESIENAYRLHKSGHLHSASVGYLKLGNELLSPPKIKKLQHIHRFAIHHELS